MGPTGAQDSINSTLPSFLDRIRSSLARPTPLAVGFGVSTRAHFEEIGAVADGVVIGSRLINIVKESKHSGAVKAVEDYCSSVSSGRTRKGRLITPQLPTPPVSRSQSNERKLESNGNFGQFGGSFVPEALNTCLAELKHAYEGAKADPEFWEEFRKVAGERKGNCELEEARGLTRACGGARIWLKSAYGLSRVSPPSTSCGSALDLSTKLDCCSGSKRSRSSIVGSPNGEKANRCRDRFWCSWTRCGICLRTIRFRVSAFRNCSTSPKKLTSSSSRADASFTSARRMLNVTRTISTRFALTELKSKSFVLELVNSKTRSVRQTILRGIKQ